MYMKIVIQVKHQKTIIVGTIYTFFISLISTNEFLQHFSDRALHDRISKHSLYDI